MASGIPVVGVRAGGVADLISDGEDGILAKPHDPKDFSEKIAFLLDHPDQSRIQVRQAQLKARMYSWNSINKALLRSYRSLIDSFHLT